MYICTYVCMVMNTIFMVTRNCSTRKALLGVIMQSSAQGNEVKATTALTAETKTFGKVDLAKVATLL